MRTKGKTVTPEERERLIRNARLAWGGFYYCPVTDRIIEALKDDDKASCHCSLAIQGTHRIAELRRATAEDYIDQTIASWQ